MLALVRVADWEARLHDWLDACRDRPFAWGRHDCVLFAAGTLLALTGVDPAAGLRGSYRSAAGSARVLRLRGARDPLALADAVLGPRLGRLCAARGDIVSDGVALGCMGHGHDGLFVGAEGAAEGLVSLPGHRLVCSWKVG